MVVYDNINMFDMAVECGAAINIENRQHLTPLTMAAFLARMDMFFHIASIEREIYWQVNKGRLARRKNRGENYKRKEESKTKRN